MDLRTYLDGERGRLVKLAEAIGAHTSDLSAWASRKRPVPIHFGWPIETATQSAVGRRDLFSADVIRKVWPDLAQQKETA